MLRDQGGNSRRQVRRVLIFRLNTLIQCYDERGATAGMSVGTALHVGAIPVERVRSARHVHSWLDTFAAAVMAVPDPNGRVFLRVARRSRPNLR